MPLVSMHLSEADTHAKLVNPAIYARGWTEDHMKHDGLRMIQVLIRDQIKGASAEGSMDTLMGRMYGLRRAGT